MDDRVANRFPTARRGVGHDGVLVGRIRPDLSEEVETSEGEESCRQYHFFLAGDQIRKGAALNAIQIADLMLS
jgi:aspartate-semialdehyde dehydrogenase